MVHFEVYLNKYVASIAVLYICMPALIALKIRIFRFLIFHPFFLGVS